MEYYLKCLLLSKNWEVFSKSRHFNFQIKSEEKIIFFPKVLHPKNKYANYPKCFILSKNWNGYLKYRLLKNEIKYEEKIIFLASASSQKNQFWSYNHQILQGNRYKWYVQDDDDHDDDYIILGGTNYCDFILAFPIGHCDSQSQTRFS